jgi:DNA-binding transcriptional MerR regulator
LGAFGCSWQYTLPLNATAILYKWLEAGSFMSQHISIGRFSVLSGLSIRALRLYDELGLLKPSLVMQHNQYRYYAPAQLELAQNIKRYRNLDLPLEQIRLIVQNPQVAQVILQEHLLHLRQALVNQQNMIQELESLLN